MFYHDAAPAPGAPPPFILRQCRGLSRSASLKHAGRNRRECVTPGARSSGLVFMTGAGGLTEAGWRRRQGISARDDRRGWKVNRVV